MNNRGIIDDVFLWVGLLFMVGVGLLLSYIAFDGVNTGIQADSHLTQHSKDQSSSLFSKFPTVFDFTFLVVFVSAFIGMLIISWFLASNPALFFAITFVVVLMGVLAASLSNAFISMTGEGILNTTVQNFPIINHLLSNLVPYVIITAFMMVIVFFAKPGGDGV